MINVTDEKGRKVVLHRFHDAYKIAPQSKLQNDIVLRDDMLPTVTVTEDGVTFEWLGWNNQQHSKQLTFVDPADAAHLEAWKAEAAQTIERVEQEQREQELLRQRQDDDDAARYRAERPWIEPLDNAQRWQYLTVNTGMFNSAERMDAVFSEVGHAGWELVNAYDKASNWFNGMEKGFLLFKRPVPQGIEPAQWSFTYRG